MRGFHVILILLYNHRPLIARDLHAFNSPSILPMHPSQALVLESHPLIDSTVLFFYIFSETLAIRQTRINAYLKRSALMNNPVKNCRRYDNDNILHKILQDKKEREVCPHHSPPVIPDFPLFLLSKTFITVHLSCAYISPPIPNSSIADSSVGASVSLTSITNSER